MKHFNPNTARGFTLIEMLVVLVIVAIVGMGSYALLDIFTSSDQLLNRRGEEMRRLSMALYRLEDDFRQLTVRPIKNPHIGYKEAFSGRDSEFEFTRLGAANLLKEPRGTLQRLHYGTGFVDQTEDARRAVDSRFVDEDSRLLLRRRWQVLDPGPESEAVVEPLLADVEVFTVRYLDRDTNAWLAQWPPISNGSSPTVADRRLPKAVEITLISRTGGEIRRTFSLPDTREARQDEGNGEDGNNDGETSDE